MSKQTDNGRAFEWAVGQAMMAQTNFAIAHTGSALVNERAFGTLTDKKQADFMHSASIAVAHILLKEKALIASGGGNGTIVFNNDAAGKNGDVRDVLITVNGKTFGISCKNNHKALKHPRLSGTADFIKAWGIDEQGCSADYWHAVTPIFNELAHIRKASHGQALWNPSFQFLSP